MLQLDHPFTLAACKSSPSSLRPEGPDPQPLLSQTRGSRPSPFTKLQSPSGLALLHHVMLSLSGPNLLPNQ